MEDDFPKGQSMEEDLYICIFVYYAVPGFYRYDLPIQLLVFRTVALFGCPGFESAPGGVESSWGSGVC